LSVGCESPKVQGSETRGGDGLSAAIMIQSRPWIFGLWNFAPWIPATLLAMVAGFLDWRYRRIPNWLTLSGLAAGVAVNTILYRWPGLRAALLGTALGLGLLLPFVLVAASAPETGNWPELWELVSARGNCSPCSWHDSGGGSHGAGRSHLERRLKRTLLNIAHLLARCSACGCPV